MNRLLLLGSLSSSFPLLHVHGRSAKTADRETPPGLNKLNCSTKGLQHYSRQLTLAQIAQNYELRKIPLIISIIAKISFVLLRSRFNYVPGSYIL